MKPITATGPGERRPLNRVCVRADSFDRLDASNVCRVALPGCNRRLITSPKVTVRPLKAIHVMRAKMAAVRQAFNGAP